MSLLPCGHPDACLAPIEVEDYRPVKPRCRWCDHVDGMKRENALLRAQLDKQAIRLAPGRHDLSDCSVIGYLIVESGASVDFGVPKIKDGAYFY